MPLYCIDPLRDSRWEPFVAGHPQGSVFHTAAWLAALRQTYGYEPIAYTTSPPTGDLSNGILFCRVQSWLTGRRLVSLPFSDHCEPLVENAEELQQMLAAIQQNRHSDRLKYIEIRSVRRDLSCGSGGACFRPATQYFLHAINLEYVEEELLRRFHKSSIQQRIRRAQREGITYECGRSADLLRRFYPMMLLARQRHRVPPQPEGWYRNLLAKLQDSVDIYIAWHGNKVIAGIMTLRFHNTVVYKYGGSDEEYHRLGAMPFLLWSAIRKAKASGVRTFDLGRSDCSNRGLIDFKEHLGATGSLLTNWRYPGPNRCVSAEDSQVFKAAKFLFGFLPDSMLKAAGNLLYRHIG